MTTLYLVPAYLPARPSLTWMLDSPHTLVALGVAATMVLAVGVAAGVGLSTVLRRKPLGQPTAPVAVAPPPTGAPPSMTTAPPQGIDTAVGQRAALITGMLTARGLVDDPQVADVIDDALRTAGVTVFDPTGGTRDPRCHRVDHTVPAPDRSHDGQIVRTLTPGYLDGDRVLRPADVVVYKWDPQ